ncbi:MAG: UvrB/UvrC motif-containing protein, partial [Bacteroidota bacterium]|nr:UvrB/UvrC motif-containing protein [Bacteroidota bacterium]
HGITPQTILKSREQILKQTSVADVRSGNQTKSKVYIEKESAVNIAADPVVAYMDAKQLEKTLYKTRSDMMKAAKEMEFSDAARLRDEMFYLQKLLKDKFGKEITF